MDGKSLFWGAVAGCCVMACWMGKNKSETKEIKIYSTQENDNNSIRFPQPEKYPFPNTVQYIAPTKTEIRYVQTAPTYLPTTTYVAPQTVILAPPVHYRRGYRPHFHDFYHPPRPPHFRHYHPHFHHHNPHHFHHHGPCR